MSGDGTTSPQDQLDREVLERMLLIARGLSASAGLEEILAVIINAMRDVLQAERATVFEHDPTQHELFSTVAHGLHAPDGMTANDDAAVGIRIPEGSGLAGLCATTRAIVNVPDAYADDRFNPEVDRRTGFRTRSILAVPLLDPDGTLIGVAQVLNKRSGPFGDRDEQLAGALASLAAVAIRRGRLIEDRLARQRLERELELAREIQQQTFPQCMPDLTGFDVDAWSEPAESTGGDAVDVITAGEGGRVHDGNDRSSPATRALLLLADATGHGVGPALNAAQIRAMLRMAARLSGESPLALERVVTEINRQLYDDLPMGRFVTAWIALLDTNSATIRHCSAGQAPILHYVAERDTVELLGADTVPLGVLPQIDVPPIREIPLAPGDVVCVVSDGILEAARTDGRQLGKHALAEVLRRHAGGTAVEISQAIRDEVERYTEGEPALDDRTSVVVKRRGA